jgi:hypothetical protein
MSNTGDFGPIISSYSRAQAIEDGVLVDVSETAREMGIKFPTAVTTAVWSRYCEDPDKIPGQDVKGRLWDVLWMFRQTARKTDGPHLQFKLYVAMTDRGNWESNENPPERGSGLKRSTHRLVTLQAVCGPGDTPEPVITIMLPGED